MPLVVTNNDWTVGIAKQSAEGTVATVATYDFPVFSGTPKPVQTINTVDVTDASSIQGDPYKAPDEHWEADISVPAFSDLLGTALVSLWPTDTATGTSPSKVHTFSGLGSQATQWFALYSKQSFSGNLQQTFEAGQCSGLSFSADENGGPLRLGMKFVGKKPTVASFTTTTPVLLSAGYFTVTGATLKLDEDSGTPAANTTIRSFTVNVDRAVTPQPTADSTSVQLISLGKVEPSLSMTLLWADWQAYRATYYGAVAGSVPSNTLVKGSVEINCVHTVTGTHTFKITVPSVVLQAESPDPDPGGGPLTIPITGRITKPGSGDHVQPILTNSVTPAY